MKIDVKDITKINLKWDEVLVIQLNEAPTQETLVKISETIKSAIPDNWGHRVLIMSGDVELKVIKG